LENDEKDDVSSEIGKKPFQKMTTVESMNLNYVALSDLS